MAVTKASDSSSAKSLVLSASKFNGVKVFFATMVQDRQVLGEKVTAWIAEHADYELKEIVVTQSSDHAFHCIAITVFYTDPNVKSRYVG